LILKLNGKKRETGRRRWGERGRRIEKKVGEGERQEIGRR
jgi:hypothetical protein